MESGGEICDVWKKKIGLRTMTVRREKDQWGESFAHEVNGVCFFAMGADYIPEDHLLGRRSKERTRKLLEDCRQANFNTIRVWGGGFYPDDWFFDLCDELGLVVWQDFMFACSVYELTEEFEANIRQEFIDNIKRIRHHACLGLWCGNNEMEMFVEERCWVTKYSEVRDYLFMYERILPEILKNMIRRPSTGRPALLPADHLTILTIRTEETSTTGKYGMETGPLPNIGNTFSAICQNLAFRPFRRKRRSSPLQMIRQTGIFFLILWKSTSGIMEPTERS